MGRPSVAHTTVTDRFKPGRTGSYELFFPASIPVEARQDLVKRVPGSLRRTIFWKDDLADPVGYVTGMEPDGRLTCAFVADLPGDREYELTATVSNPGYHGWTGYHLISLGLFPRGETR